MNDTTHFIRCRWVDDRCVHHGAYIDEATWDNDTRRWTCVVEMVRTA